MQSRGVPMRQTIVVIAVCLVCLALTKTGSASPGQAEGQLKQQSTKSAPKEPPETAAAVQIKRLSPANNAAKSNAKAATGKTSRRTQDRAASKFQARMMHSELTPAQSQETSYSSPLDSSQNSDLWQPNGSLAPTFTDQEQGDEMVALASDSSEPEQVVAPPAKSSAPNRVRSSAQDFQVRENQEQAFASERSPVRNQAIVGDDRQAVKFSPTTGAARQNPVVDEYYNDEEEDDEEISPKLSEYETIEPKERPASSNRYRHSGERPDNFGDYQALSAPPAPFDETPNYRAQVQPEQVMAPANQSSRPKVDPASTSQTDGGWHPKGNSFQSSYEPKFESHSTSGQQRNTQPGESKQPSNTAKRLASLLSGGKDSLGAFSRADVAIEYLRSMLKNKQQSLLNGTSVDSNLRQQQQQQQQYHHQQFDSSITDKNISLQRLSSFTSRLNQIFGANSSLEAPNRSGSSNATSSKSEPPSSIKMDMKKQVIQDSNSDKLKLDLIEPKSFLSQQADTKFSIVDAKPLVALRPQLDNSPLPSTPTPANAGKNAPPSYLNPKYAQDQLQIGASPNGTPLGGDYIESQDDYPRGGGLAHQQNPLVSTLVGSDSQQHPTKAHQEPRFAEQPVINQAGARNLRPPIREPPVSSTYFQMHQVPPAGDPITNFIPVPIESPSQARNDAQKVSAKDSLPIYQQQQQHQQQHHLKPLASRLPEVVLNQTAKEDDARRSIRPLHVEKQPSMQPAYQLKQSSGQQVSLSLSKLYKNSNEPADLGSHPSQTNPVTAHLEQEKKQQQQQQQQQQSQPQPQQQQHEQPANVANLKAQKPIKPPKIVSYNYFESPNDNEFTETNYQLGDALYSSNGGMEHLLSGSELEAIQSQFMTLEHPIVPMGSAERQINSQIQQQETRKQQHENQNYQGQDHNLAGILANLQPSFITPEGLQKLTSPEKQAEDALKEMASQDQPASVLAPPSFHHHQVNNGAPPAFDRQQVAPKDKPNQAQLGEEFGRGQQEAGKIFNGEPTDLRKKKSLIVYLNHPRPLDMSKATQSSQDGYNLAQSIGDQANDSTFISAKEFDSHGLSKDSKHLDISNLHGLGEIKDGQDKDGLSVVVIGDAYKYKKIVLLISSKSGGLKFIPMVKDMKK